MNERYRRQEETQDQLTEFEVVFDSADKTGTGFDNLGPSIGYNGSLFGGLDTLWLMGPAIVLGLFYGVLHWWVERRYRDSWEAYLVREHDRIDRINKLLNLIDVKQLNKRNIQTQTLLNNLNYLTNQYLKDTLNLLNTLENEKYANILRVKIQQKIKEDVDEKEAITEEQNLLSQLLGKERYEKYIALLKEEANQDVKLFKSAVIKDKTEEESITEKLKNKKNYLENELKDFHIRFVEGYLFNVLLSYSLAYWLVSYYATAAIAGGLLTTPLGWALFALVFPVFYLIYKEYTTYRTRLVQTKKEDSRDQLNFRRGWLFVGLIVAITLAVGLPVLGVSAIAAIGLGGVAFISIVGIASRVGIAIDRRVNKIRQESTQETMETSNLVEKRLERKEHARKRRQELDEIALLSIQLAHQSKLEQYATNYGEATHKIFKTTLKFNYNPEPVVDITQGLVVDEKSKDRQVTFVEKVRLVFNCVFNFLLGYALGYMVGAIFMEILGNISAVFLGPLGYMIAGLFSLFVGGCFAKRAYYTEKIHQNNLSILYAKGDVSKKQAEIDALKNEITQIREQLKELERKKQLAITILKGRGLFEDEKEPLRKLQELKPDFQFAHPVKNEGVTKRKILFGVYTALKLIISIATVSLVVRALILGGIAKLIPGVVGASLMVLGASAGLIGFVVLGVIIGVFVLKTIHDIYLEYRHKKEIEKIEHADFTIQCKKAERDYLKGQFQIMQPANAAIEFLINTPDENKESHALFNSNHPSYQPNPRPSKNLEGMIDLEVYRPEVHSADEEDSEGEGEAPKTR